MVNFLEYICPEFAAEVAIIFNNYVSGNVDSAAQTELLKQRHTAELEAAKDNMLEQHAIYERQIRDLTERGAEFKAAVDTNAAMLEQAVTDARVLKEQLETMKTEDEAKYAALVAAKDAAEAAKNADGH